jgi:hypothetical protein
VTLPAFYLLMPAGEGEPRPVVREPLQRFPALLSVTGRTGPGELSVVLVLVTTETLSAQPEEGPRFHPRGIATDTFIAHVGWPVARHTRSTRMLSDQRESGPLMVKMCRVEPDNAELFPVMLFVAFDALVRPQTAMQATLTADPVRDLRMTRKALLIVDVLAKAVARCAFVHAFQRCMRSGQFARGNLCPDGCRPHDDQEDEETTPRNVHVTISTNSQTPRPPQHE